MLLKEWCAIGVVITFCISEKKTSGFRLMIHILPVSYFPVKIYLNSDALIVENSWSSIIENCVQGTILPIMLLFERCDTPEELKKSRKAVEFLTEYLGTILILTSILVGVFYPQTPKVNYDIYGNQINPYTQYQDFGDVPQHPGIFHPNHHLLLENNGNVGDDEWA